MGQKQNMDKYNRQKDAYNAYLLGASSDKKLTSRYVRKAR